MSQTTAINDYIARSHESHRAGLTDYIDRFAAAFGAPISIWEVDAAGAAYFDGMSVEDCVARANLSHQCRRADRGV